MLFGEGAEPAKWVEPGKGAESGKWAEPNFVNTKVVLWTMPSRLVPLPTRSDVFGDFLFPGSGRGSGRSLGKWAEPNFFSIILILVSSYHSGPSFESVRRLGAEIRALHSDRRTDRRYGILMSCE